MFYADFVLSKKGPLARIWLAAHWDAKLTKAQIFETNIESSIERILRPKVKLALRTSGHLMLGVVRIYSRKTKYLLADCNEAFIKIKMAFRPGMVDLPEDHREAAVNAVTLPEIFHDFDLAMPELNDFDIEAQFFLNQSRAEEITIKEYNLPDPNSIEEDVGNLYNKGFDNDASHMSYSSLREGSLGASMRGGDVLIENDGAAANKDGQSAVDINNVQFHIPGSFNNKGIDNDASHMSYSSLRDGSLGASMQGGDVLIENDGAAANKDRQSAIDNSNVQFHIPVPNLDHGGLFQDPLQPSTSKAAPELDLQPDDDFGFDCFPPSPGGGSSVGSRPASPTQAGPSTGAEPNNEQPNDMNVAPETERVDNAAGNEGEQTTLLQNDEESFALAPVNASALKGLTRTKRKRKLIVDEVKSISGEEMKAHLNDTSDIVVTLDLAPPTKRLMRWNETGGVEKLFSLPGRCIPSTILTSMYTRHLTARGAEGCEDRDVEPRDGDTAPAAGRRGRKRKQFVDQEEQSEDANAQETQKTPRTANQIDEEFHLPPIIEEPLPNDAVFANQEGQNSAALPQTADTMPSTASVPPVTTTQDNQPLPSPYPEQNDVISSQLEDQQPTNADNLFLCAETATDSLFQGNQDVSFNPATVNMGYGLNQDQNQGLFNFNEDLDQNPATPGLNADGGVTPWHDTDYDNPASVGPPVEERGDGETEEQFEERILNKRAGQLYDTIKTGISVGTVSTFDDVVRGNARKQVAQKFYSLLVLKKHKILELTQEVAYGTIRLTKGSNFDAPKLK